MNRVEFPSGAKGLENLSYSTKKNRFAPLDKKRGIFRKLVKAATSSQILNSRTNELSTQSLEGLLDTLHEAGDHLADTPNAESIVEYKQAVRSFIEFIVRNALQVEVKYQKKNALKEARNYYRVVIIDTKLEQLAVEILANQKDKLGILQKLEEINGLLLDLLV